MKNNSNTNKDKIEVADLFYHQFFFSRRSYERILMGLPRIFNIHEVMLLLLFGRLSIERANSDKMNADRI